MLFKRDSGKAPTQADYDRMIARCRGELKDLCERLAKGEITVDQWGDGFYKILKESHGEAWYLGRSLGGDLSPMTGADQSIGRLKADLQSEYINGFIGTLHDRNLAPVDGGLYTVEDELNTGKVISRANLYLGNMRATAGEAFVSASDDDDEIDWVLGDTEKHCDECPQWADMSPYTKASLPLYPGDGTTPCLGNCDCRLVRRNDGRSMFGKPE